jgi:glycosyltransferase involved in cell wall biosynthesis
MATYNGGRYLKTQLDSILSQIQDDSEVIISDDGSTDNTIEIIKSYNDKRITLFSNSFKNPIENFEFTLTKVTGDIVFMSDQDDLWLPNKVKKMVESLTDCDLIVSDCYMGDDALNVIKESYFEWRNSGRGLLKNIWRNSYLGCCLCFKSKILNKVLPFPENIPMHDMWIGVVSEYFYNPKFINDKLIIYRRHEKNVTELNKDFSSKNNYYKRLKIRIDLITALILRVRPNRK